jgi:hypothetical protein
MTAHPTWLLWQPFWIWFLSISDECLSTGPIFLCLIGGSLIFTMFYFSLNLIVQTPTDNVPNGGICHALRCPCF